MRTTLRVLIGLAVFCLLIVPHAASAGWDAEAPTSDTGGGGTPVPPKYVPGELIVRFSARVTDTLERASAQKDKDLSAVSMTPSLDRINAKYGVKRIVPVFKHFRRNRQWLQTLEMKDRAALTGKERHLLQRLRRAPGSAEIPDLSGIYKVQFDRRELATQALADYSKDPDVVFAQRNNIYKCDQVPVIPDDPQFPDQWGLPAIRADIGWSVEKGSADVIVAVVDTGVQWDHPDLASNVWLNEEELYGVAEVDDDGNGCVDDIRGWDFVTADPADVYPGEDPGPPDNDPMDFYGHGTAVSGVVAAVTNNGLGIAGTTWLSKVMTLRAGYKEASGRGILLEADIAEALYYAANNGADVINMSFGGTERDPLMESALSYAESLGCVLVASAGNTRDRAVHYPACYQDIDVIAVAATDDISCGDGGPHPDEKAGFSTFAEWVDVSAPGAYIRTTILGGGYENREGTSFSAPFVSGLAALVFSYYPALSSTEVRRRIMGTADEIDSVNPRYAGLLGTGRVNVYRALTEQAQPYVVVDGYTIVGDGDGNGYPDPGETVEMVLRLKNIWADAPNVEAILSTADPRITVHYGWAYFGDILSDATAEGDLPVSFTVSPTVQRGEAIEFTVSITGDGGTYSVTRNLEVKISYLWPVDTWRNIHSSAVFADLDKDGETDVIFGSQDGCVYALHQDGSPVEGWRVDLGPGVIDSPAVGDINGDGDLEVVANIDWLADPGNLFAVDRYGNILPGWPIRADHCRSPVLADMDNDGDLEIIVATYGIPNAFDTYVHVLHHDASELQGWPVQVYYPMDDDPLAVGDVDGDGELEIAGSSGIRLYIWRSDGSLLSAAFPVLLSGILYSPSLADIDADGDLEIFVCSGDGTVYALHHTGVPLSGWPITVSEDGFHSSLVIGDVDGDGSLEIIANSISKKVYIWRDDGTLLSGAWPRICDVNGYKGMTPVVFDADGDGTLEVFAGNYAWRHDGSLLDGWPTTVDQPANSPAVQRFYSLGTVGVILGSFYPDGRAYLFEAGPIPTAAPANSWGVFRHDCQHTGNFGFIVGGPPQLGPIANQTINEDELLEFTVLATDPDNDHLTLSASGLPDGATFDTITDQPGLVEKRFSWIPSYAQGASLPYTVSFAVVDDKGARDSKSADIVVNNVLAFGTIYGKSGTQTQPLEGAVVAILSLDEMQPLASTTTDAAGKFKLCSDNVADGTYCIQVTGEGYVSRTAAATIKNHQTLPVTVVLEEDIPQGGAAEERERLKGAQIRVPIGSSPSRGGVRGSAPK